LSLEARPTIAPAIVGAEAGPLTQPVDARWLMAYAAALGETDPRYYDTAGASGPVAHPLFPVCYEWPVALLSRAQSVDAALAPLSVHATHDATLHRPPRAGDLLVTSARIVAVSRRRSGTLVTTRFTTRDEQGAPVTTTDYGSVYRGVDPGPASREEAAGLEACSGQAQGRVSRSSHRACPEHASDPATSRVRWTEIISVGAEAAHVYTECARIWNPIHTDIAVARAAGLSAPILHGTATLALAVSRVVAHDFAGDPTRVRRIAARFTGMVPMPSEIVVRGLGRDAGVTAFDVVTPEGQPLLRAGRLTA
jgi:acyl dehydratase